MSLSLSFCLSRPSFFHFLTPIKPRCMQLHFSGFCVLVTLLKANPALGKLLRLTFTSYTDVDECKDDRHDCHVNGTCTNTAGSFECVCNDGYFGDGRNCSGNIILSCYYHYGKSAEFFAKYWVCKG